ncbi:MAG: ribosome-associated translation inhibitor RaiA [Kiritimatiellae bacterium]|nr:ribosome-associated translation inhibitor RaiA [Kiritimatiellia bacterium]
MAIEITARNEHIGQELQQYARDKAEAICRDFPKAENVHVVLAVERHLYRAEFVVQHKGAQSVAVAETPDNMISSIEAAADKAVRQLRKKRGKQVAARHAGEDR